MLGLANFILTLSASLLVDQTKIMFNIKTPSRNIVSSVMYADYALTSVSVTLVSRGAGNSPLENANSPMEICCRPQFLESHTLLLE